MPTYEYRREDGSTFEIEQRITEDALETCPETGQKVERIISGSAGLIFKGSGFYLTDYARSNGKSAEKASESSSSSSESESTSESGSSSKDSSSKSKTSGSDSKAKE